MLICLTELPSRNNLYLNADLVAWCARKDNPLETAVVIKLIGAQGPLCFTVAESPETIAELIRWSGSKPVAS